MMFLSTHLVQACLLVDKALAQLEGEKRKHERELNKVWRLAEQDLVLSIQDLELLLKYAHLHVVLHGVAFQGVKLFVLTGVFFDQLVDVPLEFIQHVLKLLLATMDFLVFEIFTCMPVATKLTINLQLWALIL